MKICEPLLEEVTEKDILQRIFNADNQLAQPLSNEEPSTSSVRFFKINIKLFSANIKSFTLA